MELMDRAHVNVATVGVFSWTALQPGPNDFTFGWMDEVMDKLADSGRYAVLATPTAAQPAWMSRMHPDVLRAHPDGRRRHHGARVNYCPNSETYRSYAREIARRLAERYADHPALLAWHVSNEYGGAAHNGYCWCDTCAEAFRHWLKDKYGSLEELNQAYWAAFWSHTYTDWAEVDPPYEDGEYAIAALTLDWHRFMSGSMLGCYLNEARVLREVTPEVPVTTNLMGFHQGNDCHVWAPHLDVVSWDSYPAPGSDPAHAAAGHMLTYGLKQRPFLLMESAPSSTNWQGLASLKRPGEMRLRSFQAVANGADSVMYFQWRAGRGGHEKHHGAVVHHVSSPEARVFREVAELGEELESLGDALLGSEVPARIGILYDWENNWLLSAQAGIHRGSGAHYRELVLQHHKALWERNIPAHLVGPQADLADYDVIAAPMLYMLRPEWAQKVAQFVREGGTYLATFLTGWVDDSDLAYLGGYGGPLREVLGVWAEECDGVRPGETRRIEFADAHGACSGSYDTRRYCELSHADGARVLATYAEDFYAGRPAVTVNEYGEGRAYYLAAEVDDALLGDLYDTICREAGIAPVMDTPDGVAAHRRAQPGRSFLFVLNHNDTEASVDLGPGLYRDMPADAPRTGTVTLPPRGVLVLEEPGENEE
jgi:beta-galactosidase